MKKSFFLLLGAMLLLSVSSAKAEIMCTMDYTPVCGEVSVQCITTPCDPVQKTFGNRCQLDAEGAKFLSEGECPVSVQATPTTTTETSATTSTTTETPAATTPTNTTETPTTTSTTTETPAATTPATTSTTTETSATTSTTTETPAATPEEESFPDIAPTTKFFHSIKYLKKKGYVQGFGDGTFRPDHQISRYEFAKIVISARFTKEEIAKCSLETDLTFADVPKNDWFSPFVCMAKKNGIVNGYANGNFGGMNKVTSPEALKIIMEAYKVNTSKHAGGAWNEKYQKMAKEIGMTKEIADGLSYNITRAEMAEFLQVLETSSAVTQ